MIVKVKNKWVSVNYKFRGVHCWSTCNLDGVSFLKNTHHHEFEVFVKIKVTDSDRELEFIRLQHLIEGIIHNLYPNYNNDKYLTLYKHDMNFLFENYDGYVPYTANLGDSSCEMIAEEIIKIFRKAYQNINIVVGVSEDGHYMGEVEDNIINTQTDMQEIISND